MPQNPTGLTQINLGWGLAMTKLFSVVSTQTVKKNPRPGWAGIRALKIIDELFEQYVVLLAPTR